MSYIQIEIGGKLRGLKFNQGAFMRVLEKNTSGTNAYIIYAIVFAGLEANSVVKEKEFVDIEDIEKDGKKIQNEIPITYEMVSEWVDELDLDAIESIREAFQASKVFKKSNPQEELKTEDTEEINKKKLTTEPIVSESPVDT